MKPNSLLIEKTAQSIGWNYLLFGADKLISLISFSILARLVSKEDFGLIALATIAISYLSSVKGLGLGPAIVHRRNDIEDAANTVFSLNLIVGFLLSLIAILIAPFAANFFNEPAAKEIIQILSFSFIINAIGAIHFARIKRDLDFKRRTIVQLAGSIVKGFVSITLALLGYGVWSLVYGQLIGGLLKSVFVWIIYPWKPKLSINKKIAKELLIYGSSIMGGHVLSIFEDNLDYLIIGKIFNTAILGVYTLAYRLPEMLVINMLWVITGVMFPAFSTIQDQAENLKRALLSTIRYVEIIVVPICFGLFIAAEPIISVVFGSKWIEAVPVLRVLSLYALVLSIGFNIGDVYKAIGRPDIILKITIPTVIIRFFGLWIGAQISLVGVAIGHLVAGVIGKMIEIVVAKKLLNITIKDLFQQLNAFKGGFVLALFALPTLYFTSSLNNIISLVCVGFVGAVAYGGTMWFIERDSILKVFNLLKRSFLRKDGE